MHLIVQNEVLQEYYLCIDTDYLLYSNNILMLVESQNVNIVSYIKKYI